LRYKSRAAPSSDIKKKGETKSELAGDLAGKTQKTPNNAPL